MNPSKSCTRNVCHSGYIRPSVSTRKYNCEFNVLETRKIGLTLTHISDRRIQQLPNIISRAARPSDHSYRPSPTIFRDPISKRQRSIPIDNSTHRRKNLVFVYRILYINIYIYRHFRLNRPIIANEFVL